jgi:hypothetical protein
VRILKVFCGENADLAALDQPVYERGKKFEARARNGHVLVRLRVVSGGPFPICEVSKSEFAIDELEGLKVKKTR